MAFDELDSADPVDEVDVHVSALRSPAFEADTLYRIVDVDAGVVCYHLSEKDSLSCVPLSQTDIDPGEFRAETE